MGWSKNQNWTLAREQRGFHFWRWSWFWRIHDQCQIKAWDKEGLSDALQSHHGSSSRRTCGNWMVKGGNEKAELFMFKVRSWGHNCRMQTVQQLLHSQGPHFGQRWCFHVALQTRCNKPFPIPKGIKNASGKARFRRGLGTIAEITGLGRVKSEHWSRGDKGKAVIFPHYWTVPPEELRMGPKFTQYQGRVVLRGDIRKDDSGNYAVCTEQSAGASHTTAARVSK